MAWLLAPVQHGLGGRKWQTWLPSRTGPCDLSLSLHSTNSRVANESASNSARCISKEKSPVLTLAARSARGSCRMESKWAENAAECQQRPAQSLTEPQEQPCPECGKRMVRQLLGAVRQGALMLKSRIELREQFLQTAWERMRVLRTSRQRQGGKKHSKRAKRKQLLQ